MLWKQLANTLSLSQEEKARFISGAHPLSQRHNASSEFDLDSAQLASLQLRFA